MKNLEFNQMEKLQGGLDVAGCIGATSSGVGVVFQTAAILAGVASGPLGWTLLAIGTAGLVASVWNGDPCD